MTDDILTITNLYKNSCNVTACGVTYTIVYNPITEVYDLTRGFMKTAPTQGYTVESLGTFHLALQFVWSIHYLEVKESKK